MNKYYLGVDIGSLTVKVVLVDENKNIVGSQVDRTGYRGKETAQRLLEQLCKEKNIQPSEIAATVATGYGRLSFPSDREVSEISCQAKGIASLFPKAATVIDIGGQDSKVIRIVPGGKVTDFTMNDKCAAGTGRFLEVMAQALEVAVDELGSLALAAGESCEVSSTCTVFAESEVISHIARGMSKESIAAGICFSIAERVATLADRVAPEPEIVFTGGVALNPGVVSAMETKFGQKVHVPTDPRITAAYGAALVAASF